MKRATTRETMEDTPPENPSRRLLQSGAATAAAFAVAPGALLAAGEAHDDLLASLRPGHPRLLASAATWDAIKAKRGKDALLDGFLRRGEVEARAILAVPPVVYKKDGKRLLHVSRVVLRRVLLLALHFHLTDDPKLAQRAGQEMQAAAAFTDWNPSHFLDVGEMTAALAFGYDWLYDVLDADARRIVADAIAEKGLRPGLALDAGAGLENNWNAVCLGGLTLGALAVAEHEPVLASQILDKTRKNNPRGMKPYAPSGVYPEGPMYWGYGTMFEAILLAALRSALGTDWGLSRSPGFLMSADALLRLLGPSGSYFNFSDGVEHPGMEPALWWFAHTLKRPDLLRSERVGLKSYADSTRPAWPDTEDDRLLPLDALWWPDTWDTDAEASQALNWYGRGPNPLAVFRSAWDDPQAMFLALKGGKAALSHAHMDAGSFVFEADGVRWGHDLGMQDYLSLESKGVDLWNTAQDSGRWGVFRLNNLSHSTLTLNGEHHRVDGQATITHFSEDADAGAVLDLTPVFGGQVTCVTRGFLFRPGSHVLIRDEIEGLQPGDKVRWAMLTRAEITVPDASQALLTENGRHLRVGLQASGAGANFDVVPADPPPTAVDAPNPGFRLLTASLTAPASGRVTLSITLQPTAQTETAEIVQDRLAQTELSHWPQPPTE